MEQTGYIPTSMSVDLKKYRVRIHKDALHRLGDPAFIQLLVSPRDTAVAIRAVETEYAGDAVHRVRKKLLESDNSVEIYSRSFIEKLCKIIEGSLDHGQCYRIAGAVIPGEKTAIYSLKTIQKID